MLTIRDALQSATTDLQAIGQEARLEAMLLLGHSLGKPRSWLIAHDDETLDSAQLGRYRELLQRRSAGEPLAYITGEREFWSLGLEVNPNVLIPRPETELLVEAALDKLPPDTSAAIADLGTGSGAIALALASERPSAHICAVEYHPGALGVAQRNARRHALDNIVFIHGPWFAPLRGRRFDLVVSNPPYVAQDDEHLQALQAEPQSALVAGPDGLDSLRQIIAAAPAHLHAGGWLLVEHGADQGAAVHELFTQAGFPAIDTLPDLAGLDRVTLGQWKTA